MVGRRRCTSEKGVSYLSKNYAVKISVIWTCCSCSGSGCGFFVFQSLGKSQSLRSAQTFFFTVPIVIGSILIVYYTIRHTMPWFLVQKIESNRIEFSKKKFVCRLFAMKIECVFVFVFLRNTKMSKTRYSNSSLYQVTEWLMNAFLPSQWCSYAFVFKCELNWICLWFFPLFHTLNVIILLQFFFK